MDQLWGKSSMVEREDGASVELKHYADVPRRRWRVVLVTTVLCLLAMAVFLQVAPASATANTVVQIGVISTDLFDTARPAGQLVDAPVEARLVRSDDVTAAAAKLLSPPGDAAVLRANSQVSGADGGTTLTIVYTAATPKAASAGATALARAYLENRGQIAAQARRDALDQLRASLDDVRSDLARANATLASSKPGSAAAYDARTSQAVLQRQVEDLGIRQNALSSMVINPGQIVTPARASAVAISPSPKLYLAGSFAFGLALGLLLTFVRDRTDRRIRGRRDAEDFAHAPVVAELSRDLLSGDASDQDHEQLRLVRAHLGTPSRAEDVAQTAPRCVLVAGADGWAQVVATELARTSAQAHQRVALVLTGEAEVPDGLVDLKTPLGLTPVVSRLPRLTVARLASATDDVAEAAGSGELERRVSQLVEDGFQTIVAVSPGTPRSGLIALASLCDEALAVITVGRSTKQWVSELDDDLGRQGVPLAGVVLCERVRRSRRRVAPPADGEQPNDDVPQPRQPQASGSTRA